MENIAIISKGIDQQECNINNLIFHNNYEVIKSMYSKLAKAKQSFPAITKDTKGYGYFYAKLDKVITSIERSLLDNSLDHRQRIINNKLITELIDIETGHIEILSCEDLQSAENITKANDLQKFGAGISYLRRYFLLAGLGLVTEDNDAQDDNNQKNEDINLAARSSKLLEIQHICKTHILPDNIKTWIETHATDRATNNDLDLILGKLKSYLPATYKANSFKKV